MLPSHKPIGKGFFPVSTGFWDVPQNAPHWPLLFLGQDFGTMPGHSDEGETNSVPTWRNLEPLLRDAGIDARSCFFSNAVMGVRPGGTNTGRSSAFRNSRFITKCAEFVCAQLDVVKPHGVVVLGLHALAVLRKIDGSIPKAGSFKQWDGGRAPCLILAQLGPWKGPLALIVHPSYRQLNAKRRSASLDQGEGHEHEVNLLKGLIKR